MKSAKASFMPNNSIAIGVEKALNKIPTAKTPNIILTDRSNFTSCFIVFIN